MEFALSEEQTLFADSVRRFANDKLKDGALRRAHDPDYPWDVAQMVAEQGLLGITLKQEDGGLGGTLMDPVISVEQMALDCSKNAYILKAGNFGSMRTF